MNYGESSDTTISLGTCAKCGGNIQGSSMHTGGHAYHPICCPLQVTTDSERALQDRLNTVESMLADARQVALRAEADIAAIREQAEHIHATHTALMNDARPHESEWRYHRDLLETVECILAATPRPALRVVVPCVGEDKKSDA